MTADRKTRTGIRVALPMAAFLIFSNPQQARPQQAGSSAAPPPAVVAPDQQPVVVIRKESKLVLVDAVVTDKKGNYVRDLTEKDFKVYEDNKEQQVSSFSRGADSAAQASGQKRYLILFFDNSTMGAPEQIQARGAATKFIDANAEPDRFMAIVDFGGSLRIVQNFTANAGLLRAAVSGVKGSAVDPNAPSMDAPVTVASSGLTSLGNAEADFGARSMLLALRSLAKNLRTVPGRKMVVLFSGGFPLTVENQSELTATIDACNKSNVAVYALDARGLTAPVPAGSASNHKDHAQRQFAASRSVPSSTPSSRPRLVLTRFQLVSAGDPQRPGGGGGGQGGGQGGGGGHGGGGGTGGGGGKGGGGGTGGTGGGGGKGGTGGTGGGGGKGGTGGGTGGGGSRTGNGGSGPINSNFNNSTYAQARTIVPPFSPSASTNQQILAALADGTGGFTIFNTNNLLGGLERIGREQNEFYILGYVPGDSPEGSCHTLKVKMNHGGTNVRARSGYCNVKATNVLEGKPAEKLLEARANGSQVGTIRGSMETPFFYTSPDTARVSLALEIPRDAFQFNKEKGKYHSNLNVLGIAYRSDGSIGAKFSDTLNLDLEKDDWKEFTKNPFPYQYQNQFDAGAGTYKFTVVLSGGGDAFGKFETPLRIEAYDGRHFTLSGLAMTSSVQPVNAIPAGLDSLLLEDNRPLVAKGMQIIPSASNRFKRTDNVVVYAEIYEPLLSAQDPPVVGMGYRIFERAGNKEVFSTGAQRADDFIEKGSPVVAIGMKVIVKDLKPGSYLLLMQAGDSMKNNAPNRSVNFEIIE